MEYNNSYQHRRRVAQASPAEQRRYLRNLHKFQFTQQNPEHHAYVYDMPPQDTVDPNTAEFRALPAVEKIRILRHRSKTKGTA